MSLLNIMKFYPEICKATIKLMVAVFRNVNSEVIPRIFHTCVKHLSSSATDLQDICIIFEEAIFHSTDGDARNVIYANMYGLDLDEGKVKPK
jgi:hypothetical protein